jgi:hypothetical protein
MKIGPEHALQVKVNQFVREVVLEPHVFFSIDRSARHAQFEHVRQKARGMIAGISDTVLLCSGIPAIIVELKAPGKTPDDNQYRFGAAVQSSKHYWGWCDSVAGYRILIAGFGVPMRPDAALIAARHDAALESAAIRREEAMTGKPSPKRKAPPRFTAGKRVQARAAKAGIRL